MPTSRLKLRPLSPWRTPWQADTLTGMLMAVCARVHGPEVLRDLIMDPMLDGNPPFVLSDACPGDLLPIPVWLRLADWPDADRKRLKRARWLQPGDFHRARRGEMPAADALIPEDQVFREDTRQHNTLDRLSNTTGEAESGLGIFSRPETRLRAAASAENGGDYLSVYFRILEPGAEELLVELFDELALTGFGADTATGRGQFEILGEPEALPLPDEPAESANSVVALSTFQPGRNDPVDGVWRRFRSSPSSAPTSACRTQRFERTRLSCSGREPVSATQTAPSYLSLAAPSR